MKKTYLREWIVEGIHCRNNSLDILNFENKKELEEERKQLKESHPTIFIRYFKLKEESS